MNKRLFVFILALMLGASAFAENYASLCNQALNFYIDRNWSPRTGLVYTCTPDKVRSSADCENGMFHWYKGIPGGYGVGMGDCALIMGTALSGVADKALVTKDKKERKRLQAQANLLAQGMINLETLHGIKGFVARGICEDDAKSICSLSSIDQYTHWEHSLWRYATSDLADKKILAECKRAMTEVAEFMEARITEENGWNFGLADGTVPDPRGICTMWGPDKKPHAAARLPMVYCATYLVTGDKHWEEMYERYIDQALEMTLKLKDLNEKQVMGYMPAYSLYQAMCSLEVILAHEKNPQRVAKIHECMAEFSRRAHFRAMNANPAKPPYGMCWDGELLLAQMLDPNFKLSDDDLKFIGEAITRKAPEYMGWCRAAHMYAAYWRFARRNGK